MLQLSALQALPWLRHCFTMRAGGVSTVYGDALNMGYTAQDASENVVENRRRAVLAVMGAPAPLVAVRQVHGTSIHIVESAVPMAPGAAAPEADALVTAVAGVVLGIQAADCVPILLVDTRQRVVAAVHAGWRGTAAAIVSRAAAHLEAQFNSNPADLRAAIGPAIGLCCYKVGDEVRERFGASFRDADQLFAQRSDGVYLDLAEANRRQLLGAGLQPATINLAAECTACARLDGRRKFFSHRAEAGVTGRAMGLIGIVPGQDG